ncbi:MAG: hypothetical protein SGI77_28055 [Pirellulaceae bacterium]|nr:hypothetical protein [Pirellulaceae bacterium]
MRLRKIPRLPRVQYPGAIYPLVTRGDGRRTLFHDDGHYLRFTQGLSDVTRFTESLGNSRYGFLNFATFALEIENRYDFLKALLGVVPAALLNLDGERMRKSFFGWRWLGFGFLAFLIGVLFLPTLLGSRWIYEPIIRRLEAGDFRLDVGSVQLRWLTPLVLRDVVIQDANGPAPLRIREVRTDRGLLASLLSGRRVGRVEIIEPIVDIELLTDGSNLTRLVKSLEGKSNPTEASKDAKSKPPAIDLDVSVKGLVVRVEQANQSSPLIVIPPLDLSIAYRAADNDSMVHIEPAQLLNDVAVTPELMKLGLEYAIPLLAKSAWFDGRVSIATGPIDIPLDALEKSTGLATITLHEVRSGPSDQALIQVLDLIAKIRGKSVQHELVFIDGSNIEIQIAEQRVSHRGFKLGLPKIDPRLQLESFGSVGIDDRSLDLKIDFPIPVEQLARRDEVRELGVPMIKLPIRGTLDEPRVEWLALRGEGADLLGIIRQRIADEAPRTAAVLGGLEGLADGQVDQAIGAVFDLLQEVGKSRQGKNEPKPGEPDILPDSTAPEEPKSKRPILDALKKLLRDDPPQK